VRRLLIGAVVVALVGVPLASGAARHAARYPSSMAALGTSTAAGWGSDPAHPFRPTRENSWATGTNPAVQSIYSRLLAANPAIKGHNANFVGGGSPLESAGHELEAFADQVHQALRLKVKPELVLVQVIDRAVKCDGTTERNFTDYGAKFSDSLDTLAQGLPNAQILVISQWGTFASYAKYLKGLDEGKRLKNAGKKPCQLVDYATKQVSPTRVAYARSIVAGEEAQLRAACAKVPNCHYDGGAASRIAVTAADVADFQFTPTIQGQAKLAAAEWKVLSSFVK
jgi:hypothetical protein